ncbi:MAG: hypothetical protein IJ457_04430 [Clostridia bacterium]|nr:hypothetical protein [Clostridia bacterium]
MYKKLHSYVKSFNEKDNELYSQLIPNSAAEEFLAEQIPLIDIPDKVIEKTYYFRWWTYRKHIKETEIGHVITEFLPPVGWSGPYNTINCPAGFHIREGRWLRDDGKWIKEYINFWLDETGASLSYSSWYAHAVMEYCTVKNDYEYAVECLPKLVRYFEKRAKENRRDVGLYYSVDDRDGMEYSIGTSGLRPTGSSYAYGDATAIAKIADMAGDTEIRDRFEKIAAEIKEKVEKLLWDGDFFKTIPQSEECNEIYTERPLVPEKYDARELVGYIPWYFNLPSEGKDAAFAHLLTEEGFKAPCGITTAERRHPRFMEKHGHMCLWNGPVWPFATSQVLVAMSNLLRNYNQSTLTKDDYYEILRQYAESHKLTLEDGTVVPWIDENLDPFSGSWIARDILLTWEDYIVERGKDYNHSLFCDLVLSGLLGISVKDGKFTADPLIPDDWDHFRVDNLHLNGKRFRVVYDKDGSVYGMGKGLSVQSY